MLAPISRLLLLIIMSIAASMVSGQGGWAFSYPAPGSNSIARDAVELQDGNWTIAVMTNFFRSELPKRSYLVLLDPNGGAIESQGLRYTDLSIGLTALVPSDTSLVVHAIGYSWDSIQTDGYGFVHYIMDEAMNLLDSTRLVFDTLTNITLKNATLDQDANIFLVGGSSINNSAYPRTLLLLKLSQTGDSLNSNLLGSDNGLTSPQQAIQYDGDMMVATDGATIGPAGYGKFLRFDDQLQYVTGFSSLSLSGTGVITPVDSVMRKNMSLYALPSGNLLVSAVYGNWFPDGYRTVIGKVSGDGEPLQYYFPRSDLPHDYAAELSGIEKIDASTFLYAMLEGFDPDPPGAPEGVAPSRVHIFRMDTSLNVLCDYVVDGFADSTYYYLQRVKYTSDGGTLLMGSRQDLSIPNSPPKAWVQKLGPNDCNVGIADHARPTAQVFPNPGSSGFTVLLNGNLVNNGRLVLSDAQGRHVSEATVWNNTAQLSAERLVTGMYFYRITDTAGRPVATGKWVKE